ncbi:hypothetical protein [Thalassotalea euphylliae]|uniref:Phage portal protein n=1 Tax=Thalassotalea euphylliae TaxID=1655234 RepID=A0A3E0U6U1_9GAMM|nr:hypothetical protein [Thalassotalea euphylliae]REL32529.1 hypothetical protein DXX94_18435 [Thalassotalea euphylliae]
MSWNKPSTWFGGKNAEQSTTETDEQTEQEVTVRESYGVTVDNEIEQGFRRISEDSERNLSPMAQERMRKVSYKLWESNQLANRIIELPLAYILAEGVKITHPEEYYQSIIDQFINNPINNFKVKLEKRFRELAIFGEQFWPLYINEFNGAVQMNTLANSKVETVIFDPDNEEQPIGVITKRDTKGNYKRYRVIINGPETLFTQRTQQIRESFADGDIYYCNINSLLVCGRGKSDLQASADFLDLYDEFLFGEAERADFMRLFLWDVTLTGADEDEVKKRAKEIQTPGPNAVRVHNENEVWKAESPNLNSEDTDKLGRLLRNHVLGGKTIPEHWFGGGGDVNRATGESMSEPTLKMLTMRQNVYQAILFDLVIYALRQHELAINGREPDFDHEIYQASIEFPEMTAKDTSKYATALQQVVVACQLMVQQGFVTEQTALKPSFIF